MRSWPNRLFYTLHLLLFVAVTRSQLLAQNLTRCVHQCVNNGIVHCLDESGETESICGQVWCLDKNGFLCASGRCIPYAQKCDGINDCPGGEDEQETLCAENAIQSQSTPFEIDIVLTTPITSKEGCVVQQLPYVMVKQFNDAVLQSGTWVPQGTLIYYDCPAGQMLKGRHQNTCKAAIWTEKFPFCASAATAFELSLVIPVLLIVIIILLLFLYRLRGRKTEDHICLHPSADNNAAKHISRLKRLARFMHRKKRGSVSNGQTSLV